MPIVTLTFNNLNQDPPSAEWLTRAVVVGEDTALQTIDGDTSYTELVAYAGYTSTTARPVINSTLPPSSTLISYTTRSQIKAIQQTIVGGSSSSGIFFTHMSTEGIVRSDSGETQVQPISARLSATSVYLIESRIVDQPSSISLMQNWLDLVAGGSGYVDLWTSTAAGSPTTPISYRLSYFAIDLKYRAAPGLKMRFS